MPRSPERPSDEQGSPWLLTRPTRHIRARHPVLTGPPPVLVAVAEPAPQRRLTVAFRFLLAVPHLFVLLLAVLAAGVVAFIGWWGALFTGAAAAVRRHVPERRRALDDPGARVQLPAHRRLPAVHVRRTTPTYPVRVAIPEPQRLNRAAVFFRYFLAIPAALPRGPSVGFGASTLMAFVAWLIVLVAGQLPASFYLAYAAVMRFQTRYTCFWWMLTPAYPGGLYGDRPGTTAWADALPAAQAPQGYGTPAPGVRHAAGLRRAGSGLRHAGSGVRRAGLGVRHPWRVRRPCRLRRAAALPARHVAAPAHVRGQEAGHHVHRASACSCWLVT